jgi:hypothetical protein
LVWILEACEGKIRLVTVPRIEKDLSGTSDNSKKRYVVLVWEMRLAIVTWDMVIQCRYPDCWQLVSENWGLGFYGPLLSKESA